MPVMKIFTRLLLPLALAIGLFVPGIGSDGGDNAGGTGVWILPRANFLASDVLVAGSAMRGTIHVANCTGDVKLAVDTTMGSFTATLIDPVSGSPVALPTTGRQVVLDSNLLNGLKESGIEASVVISDGQHLGYVMTVGLNANGCCTVKVY